VVQELANPIYGVVLPGDGRSSSSVRQLVLENVEHEPNPRPRYQAPVLTVQELLPRSATAAHSGSLEFLEGELAANLEGEADGVPTEKPASRIGPSGDENGRLDDLNLRGTFEQSLLADPSDVTPEPELKRRVSV
jgi:hypothetical protein